MRFEKYLIIVSIVILIMLIIVQYTIYNSVKERTIQNINSGEMIYARQAASGIHDYINDVINTLKFFSRFPEIVSLNTAGKQILENYQQNSSEEIKGVTRVDADGKIAYTFPDKEQTGKDISQQAHIRLSMETHNIVISDVFMAVQGFRTVAVHVPVFKKDKFDGTLAFLLSFDKIAQKYIENIHIGKNGYAWVISKKGIEISSPFPDHIGRNFHDIYKNSPEIISMVEKMLKRRTGVTTYNNEIIHNRKVQNVLEHAVYMPISLRNTFWSIVIIMPEDEVVASLYGLRTQLLLINIALLIIYTISVYLIIRYKNIIGEQRKREAVVSALQESEVRYKTLFEQNPAPMLIYELGSLNLLAVNDAFSEHYGYGKQEAAMLNLTDLYPESEKIAIADLSKKIIGLAYAGEWHHKKKDGTLLTVEVHSHGFSYKGMASRVAVITDITKRRQTEQILESNEKQLSLIFGTVSDVIYLLSVEPGDCFRFISVNPAFLSITGLSREQVIGKIIEDVLPGQSHKLVKDKYRQAISENRTVKWEEISEYPSGMLYGEVAVTPTRNAKGECTNLIGSVHDITGIRRVQEEIYKLNQELEQRVIERTAELESAKERAEAADRLKSAFLATMSHELRTPLNSIIGFTGILIMGIAGPLNDEQLKQLRMAKSSAQHLLELINDVLDLSKIEAGELVVSIKSFDLRKTIQRVISSIKPLAQKKGLKLQSEISEGVKEIINDERRVEQILINLLNNAVKFTDEGYIKVVCEIKDRVIITKVIDSGIGIKGEDMDKLFIPFSQIDTGLTRTHEGTGLGLSISHKLAEKMGGTIKVESEAGKGSTFIFLLPLNNVKKF